MTNASPEMLLQGAIAVGSMRLLGVCVLTLICGAMYEITSVYWVLATEKLRPKHAAFWSMVQALVMLTGIGESIKSIPVAACFVFGYSVGSAIGIKIENWRRGKTPNAEVMHSADSAASKGIK